MRIIGVGFRADEPSRTARLRKFDRDTECLLKTWIIHEVILFALGWVQSFVRVLQIAAERLCFAARAHDAHAQFVEKSLGSQGIVKRSVLDDTPDGMR